MRKNLVLLSILLVFVSCKTAPKTTYISYPGTDFFLVESKHFPMVSVHRGGGEPPFVPENCIESFEFYAEKIPSIIECDIVMSKDSILYMMHDATLDRTTTGTGNVYDAEWEYVKNLNIKDNFGNITPYKVPSLEQVLLWGKNKVLFTLDVKKGVPFDKVIEMVRKTQTENISVIITYNADDAKTVYDLAPELLISVGIMKEEDYHRLREFGVPDKNMIAFIGTREPQKELIDFLHSKRILTILGVLGNLDRKAEAQGDHFYRNYMEMGVDILSTDRPEAVYEIIKTLRK